MERYRKKLIAELEAMQEAGRMLRNLSLARMTPMGGPNWQPPMDIYEAETAFFLIAELAGVGKDDLRVVVDEHQIRISGARELPLHQAIACVHQLEIEVGRFERTLHLPAPVDIERVSSVYRDGMLVVTLPKKTRKSRVRITVISGE